jgi:hypothetical protein
MMLASACILGILPGQSSDTAWAEQQQGDGGITADEIKWCANPIWPNRRIRCATAWAAAREATKKAKELFPEETQKDGTGDAFRHCYWNGLMTLTIGIKDAETVADNYEDRGGNTPEARSMDEHNNEMGRRWAQENKSGGTRKIAELCRDGTRVGGGLVYLVGHHNWSGAPDNSRTIGYREWAMTTFVVHQPYLRSVEVNVSGPGEADLIVYRSPAHDQWEEVAAARPVVVPQDGEIENRHTKYVFENPVRVTVGEKLYLQVFNREDRPMEVYFSEADKTPEQSYVWCPGDDAEACTYDGGDLRSIVYGWHQPSF